MLILIVMLHNSKQKCWEEVDLPGDKAAIKAPAEKGLFAKKRHLEKTQQKLCLW